MPPDENDHVSRSRFDREVRARQEAEDLLEAKSRELFTANQRLSRYSGELEQTVQARTAELQLALEAAQAASLARGRFIATMSHEIRTPLGGLLGMIDLLAMDESDPKRIELLNYAKLAGNGLRRIVNDVLDFSKMEAGLFVFQEENVDLRALVGSVVELKAMDKFGEGRTILKHIAPAVPALFRSDATRIRQVISNLVSNALRYSTTGPVTIRADAEPQGDGASLLRVAVEDHGIGISAEKLGSLFKDFSQVQNPLTAAAEGTGLGLAISKRIIDGLGGTIHVESEPGRGSTFRFELPVRVVEGIKMEPRSVVDAAARTSLAGKSVLIAEDNIINQEMLMAYARRMRLNADLAENGLVALEKFSPGKYDLILMDVAMPVMDGLEAAKQLRAQWQHAEIPPIVALTAHVMDAISDEARSVGITKVLTKPIPFDTLEAALKEVLFSHNASGANVVQQPVESLLLGFLSTQKREELQKLFTPEDILRLAKKFVADCGDRLAVLTKALAERDMDTVHRQAHSIKGSASVLGIDMVTDLAREIEQQGAADIVSLEALAAAMRYHLDRMQRHV